MGRLSNLLKIIDHNSVLRRNSSNPCQIEIKIKYTKTFLLFLFKYFHELKSITIDFFYSPSNFIEMNKFLKEEVKIKVGILFIVPKVFTALLKFIQPER